MSMVLSGFPFFAMVIIFSLTMAAIIPIAVLTVLWLNNEKYQVLEVKEGESLTLKIYNKESKDDVG